MRCVYMYAYVCVWVYARMCTHACVRVHMLKKYILLESNK